MMQIAYGSTLGKTHRNLDYNNQDAIWIHQADDLFIGLIADGCGSGANSEIGAQLGVRFVAKYMLDNPHAAWQATLGENIRLYSQSLTQLHTDEEPSFIRNYLLYTLIGIVIEHGKAIIFSCGDGVTIVDGQVEIIDQNNRPTYVNNVLLGEEPGEFRFQEINLSEHPILIGSDGVVDFLHAIKKGEISAYPSLEIFLSDDRLFQNSIFLPKLLQSYSKQGILQDDCSIILLKA